MYKITIYHRLYELTIDGYYNNNIIYLYCVGDKIIVSSIPISLYIVNIRSTRSGRNEYTVYLGISDFRKIVRLFYYQN